MTMGKSAAPNLAEERRARKQAERLLEESTTALALAAAEIKDTKARFLDFAEIASDWLWEMDAEFRFSGLMGYFSETTGLNRDDVIGKTLLEIGLFGIDEEETLRQLEFFKEHKPFRGSIGKIRNREGHRHYLNVSGRPVFSPDGVFLGYRGTASDITQAIEAEAARDESEGRVRGILENVADGVITINEEGKIESFNPAAEKIFGYTGDEIMGRAVTKLMTGSDRRRHNEGLHNYLETGKGNIIGSGASEIVARHKDGTIFPISLAVGEMHIGRRRLFIGSVRDTTMRQQAEQALRDSEARFRGLAEGSIQGVIVHREFRALYANQACADIFGHASPDEILALDSIMSLVELHEHDRLEGYRERRVAGKQAPAKYELQGLRKDGAVIWLEAQVSQVIWDGAPATQAAIVDITERKRAEQNLLTSETRFRDFAESAGDLLWELDEHFRFTYISPNVTRIPIASPEAYYGKTMTEMLGDDYGRTDWEDHNTGLRARKPFTDFTYSRLGDDGAEVWVRTSGVPVFDANGLFKGYRGAATDITELKHAEESRADIQSQLFQAQKTEALGTLAGGIAHDFNNILTIIMGHAELLELDFKEDSTERRSAEKILDAGRRATGLVQQILAFTRQQKQSFEPVLLDRLVDETQQLLRATIPSTIEIRTILPAGPVTILGDATQIHQVVMNLCINASHAIGSFPGVIDIELAACEEKDSALKTFEGTQSAEAGMPVEIATSENGEQHSMRIGIPESGDCYRLSIRDTGTGMDRTTLERAFDPFFTTKEVGKGTGIGLSAVQGIVAVHGGALGVETVARQGSTFTVYFPSASADAAAAAQSGEDEPKGGSARILFVDDESALVDIAVKTLEPFGYQVTGMSDSEKALKIYVSNPDDFDLIVTDLTMPKVTGIEIARAATGARPDIPVILCTGYSENLDQPRAQAEGVHELLYKPVFGRKLVNAVERALSPKSGKEGK